MSPGNTTATQATTEPTASAMDTSWLYPSDSEVVATVRRVTSASLAAYREQPLHLEEHLRVEADVASGAYFSRQVYELVQNAADAILEGGAAGRIEVVLTDQALYCANEGAPVTPEGATSILLNRVSYKREEQIGHFGIGFKSVLAITDRPEFYSRSGSFRFSASESLGQIREVIKTAQHAPVLRLAFPLDAAEMMQQDEMLAGLMSWASTVVRLPLTRPCQADLSRDLKQFGAEFLLFCPHVDELRLHDQIACVSRELRSSRGAEGDLLLSDNEVSSRWRVFGSSHSPQSDGARFQANNRNRIPLSWAVATEGRSGPGSFWAFFPTSDETSLRGVLNGGWQTTSDRHSLVDGPLNDELLTAAAALVAQSLAGLAPTDDPARFIDLLPAEEDKGVHDRKLAAALFERLAATVVLPDSDGVRHLPSELSLLPALLPENAVAIWSASAFRSTGWAHWTTNSRIRRKRAERMGARSNASYVEWLESLVTSKSVAASREAILAAAAIAAEGKETQTPQAKQAKIVLTEDGTLAPANWSIWLRGSIQSTPSATGYRFVALELEADPDVRDALVKLGVRVIDGVAALEHAWPATYPSEHLDWERMWAAVRRTSPQIAEPFLQRRMAAVDNQGLPTPLFVRTADGGFRSITEVLLPGRIVSASEPESAGCRLDLAYHSGELELLRSLGLADGPSCGGALPCELSLSAYLTDKRRSFKQECREELGSTPRDSSINVTGHPVTGPLDILKKLPEAAKACYCEELARLCGNDEDWEFQYDKVYLQSHAARYKAPAIELLLSKGRLPTSLGPSAVDGAVGAELREWDHYFAVSDLSGNELTYLGLPASFAGLRPQHWAAALMRAATGEDLEASWRLYDLAITHGQAAPAEVACRLGEKATKLAPSDVCVVSDDHFFACLVENRQPVIRAASEASAVALRKEWAMLSLESMWPTTIEFQPAGPEELIRDRLPDMRVLLADEGADMELQPCLTLELTMATPAGRRRLERRSVLDGKRVLFRHDLAEEELRREITSLLHLGPLPAGPSELQLPAIRRHNGALAAAVAAAETPAEKLAAAIGKEGLLRHLPEHIVVQVGQSPAAEVLAKVILAVYGTGALRELGYELRAGGLDAPHKWAGGSAARAFVKSLGFPEAFAGIRTPHKDPWLEVDGPPSLGPLHDFQAEVATRIRDFLAEDVPGRGMLALPTGSGKTRVVAETLVRAYREGCLGRHVLWVADREELCEQAVQCWQEVWRAFGPNRTLRISRLWGGANEKIVDVEGRPHLVVATYQTLRNRLTDAFGWLSQPECIVVDEAHGSTAPSYTTILGWLGLDARRTSRRLIGMTATPFRGGHQDDEETRRLVDRFGKHRFDVGVFDGGRPHEVLQARGILSHVDHRVLAGTQIDLTESEQAHLMQFKELPAAAEQRLGEDQPRNAGIMASILSLPPDWPVLMFAASVDHAELIAAQLSLAGIEAQAISNRTPEDARFHAIQGFRRGEIRVLTNYNLLSTGFDAPRTRAVLITRPVFSPGLYQQMIGRGLRGPANGGTDRCLIVDVADNFIAYEGQLAFHHFDHLWARS